MSGWLSVNNKVLNSLWVHPVPRTLSAAGKNLIRKCISNRAASFNPGFLSELEVVQHAREAIALEALSRKSKTNEISPPEQLASFLPKSSMQMSFSNHILSSLPLKTPTDALKAVRFHSNQEPALMREMLLQRISNDTEAEMPFAGGSGFGSPTLRISIDTKKLARIAKTVAKALQDHFQGSKSDSPSGYISENYNPIALDSDSNFNVDELDDVNFRSMSSAQQDSYECANVLKKRRKKMRKHKYKKRLKANRYKNKK